MRHGRARRLLAALPDGSLPAALEADLRAHLEACRVCRRHFAMIEAGDSLLRLLPAVLVPLEPSPVAAARLAALARWAAPPRPVTWLAGLRIPALGALTAAAALAMVLSLGSWTRAAKDPSSYPAYAAMDPIPAQTPYSWR